MATKNIHDSELYSSDVQESTLVTLGIRLPAEVRDNFMELCLSRNTNASKVIRNFINRELMNAATQA